MDVSNITHVCIFYRTCTKIGWGFAGRGLRKSDQIKTKLISSANPKKQLFLSRCASDPFDEIFVCFSARFVVGHGMSALLATAQNKYSLAEFSVSPLGEHPAGRCRQRPISFNSHLQKSECATLTSD